MGFFTDATLCIGCKACEVACKQWNQLPADGLEFTGYSYDNTKHLGATTWRHVAFKEKVGGGLRQMADGQRRLQALRIGPMPAIVSHRLDHLQRVRQRLCAAGHLQRLRVLRSRVPVRRHRSQP